MVTAMACASFVILAVPLWLKLANSSFRPVFCQSVKNGHVEDPSSYCFDEPPNHEPASESCIDETQLCD